jgi:uncharacterized protein YciW
MRALVLMVLVASCTAGVDVLTDEGDEALEDETISEEDPADLVVEPIAASPFGVVRVAQLNPYYAGRLAPYTTAQNSCSVIADCNEDGRAACSSTTQTGCYECIDRKCRQRNWETMEHAARLFDAIHADVIGVQELHVPYAAKIDTLLQSATGTAWSYRNSAQGVDGKGSGVGVYWREDRVELVADLGYVEVDKLPSRYSVRFHGVILRDKSSGKQFGFFSGKLVWGSAGDDADRKLEAQRLKSWIDAQMAKYPAAKARIIASDFNDTIGSGAYNVFGAWDDGGAVKGTHSGANPRERIDYLFWADSSAGASQRGFVTTRSDGRLGRSEYFGSDHRFVYGDARIP